VARLMPLVEQAAQFDQRSQHEAERREAGRSTFDSCRMWLMVAAVWGVACAVLALKLARVF